MIGRTQVLAGVVAAGVIGVGAAAPAAADPQAEALCADASIPCDIVVGSSWLREGTTVPVTIVGSPQVRLEVVALLVVTDAENSVLELEEVGSTGEVFTSIDGRAQAELALPSLPDGGRGGLVLLGTAGTTEVDTSTFGAVLPFGTTRPTLLGDGYGIEKPAGARLVLQLTGTIPGSRFRVEHQDAERRWIDATATGRDAPEPAGPPDEVHPVTYFIPQGLPAEPRRFRLVNASTGDVVEEWEAIPTLDAATVPARTPLTPADLGATATTRRLAHPLERVRIASAAVAGLGIAVVALGVPLANHRAHRRDRRG